MTLSERNTVELIIKLKELGFLDSDLLHTSNGREYVTRSQLVEELGEVLQGCGGRLSLVELPSLLGMDLAHCQAAADALCASSDQKVILANGELFSSLYFTELAKEMEDTLQSAGILALADVARVQGLTMEMLSGEVSKNIGTIIHGIFDKGSQSLYTNAYIGRVKCQIRGALRACLHPLQISVLKKDICGVEGPAAFFPGLVDDVVTHERLDGKIASGMNMWIPNSHLELQMKAVDSFFVQNHYVSVEYANKNGIENEQAYFEKMDPTGFMLDTVYISPQIIHSLVAILDDAVISQDSEDGFCDVQDHLPADFSSEDAAKFVQHLIDDGHLGQKESSIEIFCDTCLVSDRFLASISHSLQTEAAEVAKKDFTSAQQQSSQPAADSKAKKGKAAGKQQQQDDDSDDDWSMQKGGKGKKKGKGGNKAKMPTNKSKSAVPSKKNTDSHIKTSDYISSHIIKLYPEIESYDDLLEAITTSMVPIVSAAYDKATNDLFTAGASRRKEIKEKASAALQNNFYWIELFSKGTDIVFVSDAEDTNRASASWHVIKSNGLMCLDPLLHFLNADISQSNEKSDDLDDVMEHTFSQAQRTAIIQECPGQLSEKLSWMLKATKSNIAKDIAEFIDMAREAAEESGIRLKSLDKKTESSLIESHESVLQEQLSLADSSPTLLAAAVPILLLKHMKACTNLAGKSLSHAIQSLASSMEEKDVKTIEEFHENVLAQLRGDQGLDETTSATLFEKVKSLCSESN